MGKVTFDPGGIMIAERDDRVIGFVHAVFGPDRAESQIHEVSHRMGATAMMLIDPTEPDPAIDAALFEASERYLRDRGAVVLYAGGQAPLNPFYWGLYGGSEWAGILGGHARFHQAALAAKYQAVSETVLMEARLDAPAESRIPRWALLRRQTRLEISDDPPPGAPWEELAIGDFFPVRFELVNKADDRVLARAVTWDMEWFSRLDNRPRIGLFDFYVEPEHRRQGLGKLLVSEIFQTARNQGVEVVSLQTRSTNHAALALYESMGFTRVETSTLYRLPAEL